MESIERKSPDKRFGRTLGAAVGMGALLVTVGCGVRDGQIVPSPTLTATAGQAGAPVVVTCEPNQRTLVRPVVVNGATLSQVECITNAQLTPSGEVLTAPPSAAGQYRTVRATQPVYDDLGDARIVSEPPTRTVARPVRTRQVVYDEPVRKTRSVKKSAIIIGSSAGVGAGVGAAVGGKKGALIGAAIGGGSAAIWDQVTRRND
jgi:hypothetical protein